ncbi:MAG: bifunctional anthranilate synthase component I family protein/aminotransferase class IV, partial [Proteobacteria bacterium]|nr:bifunctional anthranilate synthase component I family protein/aminotransferase class IV [Pseudomonadota bacterium]
HNIVSTSPERFLKRSGRFVETRPIKGTIARGATQVQDEENSRMLAQSLKDDAELTMIVDLMRNDLSRVTESGSVVVSEHKCIEPYENVFHLVSVVQGILEPDKTSVDLLKATFPGGSITGCPKIRAMEIIDELEPVKRHVYTGSIGYISFHDTLDLSIAIRTATIAGDHIMFSVGGGIVYDSDPEKEYQETLDKGKTLMESLSGRQLAVAVPEKKAWVDGRLMDQNMVKISATSTGFQYGAGVFETIRVEGNHVFRLKEHVARMNASWQSIFEEYPPDITWEAVIRMLIRENKFQDPILAVKLLMAKDDRNFGKPYFLAAFLRPYIHRLELAGKDGLDLITYPHARQSPLADHKTLNYLYYEQAMRYARSHGRDEALILNSDDTVSETNTANILAIDGNTVWIPESLHVLPGVTQKTVLTILSDKGYDICPKKMFKDQIYSFPNIILTNALMGAVKVLSIDGKKTEHTNGICSQGICAYINAQLFNRQ